MCEHCKPFANEVKIESSPQLRALHERLYFEGVKPGILVIVDGSLQWSDNMACTLRCMRCGQQFQLFVETYHGIGGTFSSIPHK